MKQWQLDSDDWYIKHCPAYLEKYDNCRKALRVFSHCKKCPISFKLEIKEKLSFPKECHRLASIIKNNQHQLDIEGISSIDCGTCQSKGQKDKSCRLLTKRSFKQRKKTIQRKKKRRIKEEKSYQKWLSWRNPKLYDEMYESSMSENRPLSDNLQSDSKLIKGRGGKENG